MPSPESNQLQSGGYRSLLRIPAARRLALCAVPADFADWLDYAAVLALLVFSWGQGPFVLALFALCLTLPYITAGPLLAVYVDRWPLARTLLWSNVGRAAATLALTVAPGTAAVLLLVLLRGCIDSAFNPARQAAIQATTPPELLGIANGMHHAINQTAKIAGPALGGLLLTLVPAQSIFVLNGLLSLATATFVLGLRLPSRTVQHGAGSFLAELGAGAAEFRRNRVLVAALVFTAVAYFSFFLYDALTALLVNEFNYPAWIFGFGIAASGAGGLFGATLAGVFGSARPFACMVIGALVAGLVASSFAVLALSGQHPPSWMFLLIMALAGGSAALMLVPYRSIVQAEAPPERIARVFAFGEGVTMAVMLSAPFLGSAIAASWGTGAAFLAGGVVLLVLGVAGAAILALRWRA